MQFSQKGKRDKKNVPRRDPEKEAMIGALSATLTEAGFLVRREELKRGLGWRAMSGVCRAMNQNIVFVDKRLSHDEQISFLQSQISALLGDVNHDGTVDADKVIDPDDAGGLNNELPLMPLPPV